MARESVNSGLLFDLVSLDAEIEQLSNQSEQEDFWKKPSEAREVISRLNYCKEIVTTYRNLLSNSNDLMELLELEDESIYEQIEESLVSLEADTKEFEMDILFTGEFDSLNAIIEIHPGAGGTEAQDWADMLYRMYVMYAQNHRFKMSIVYYEPGDEAGLKTVTIKISGKNAYGLLKSEKGVHRLVRISPFDANKRRHTSFASVNVIPEFDDDIEVEINPDDLKVDTFRSGGAGGQNVNKVSSAVRITHLPTGIVVSSQVERSQLQNKENCMKMLKGMLYQREVEKKQKELDAIVGVKNNIESGTRYETCRSIHAEQNAIIQAGQDRCQNATMYIWGHQMICILCKRFILQAQIKNIILKKDDNAEIVRLTAQDLREDLEKTELAN